MSKISYQRFVDKAHLLSLENSSRTPSRKDDQFKRHYDQILKSIKVYESSSSEFRIMKTKSIV